MEFWCVIMITHVHNFTFKMAQKRFKQTWSILYGDDDPSRRWLIDLDFWFSFFDDLVIEQVAVTVNTSQLETSMGFLQISFIYFLLIC